MPRIPKDETGITNLGPIPAGMTLLDGLRATRGQRKFRIDPDFQSGRMTVCETMREVWKLGCRIGGDDGAALMEMAAAGYDFGKRMDARMKELKAMLNA